MPSIGNFVIRTYQRYVSREYNTSRHAECSFAPSCSEYGREAMQQHGLVTGFIEGTMRMASCCPQTHVEHRQAFFNTLAAHEAPDLEQIVRTDSPHAHEVLQRLKTLTDEELAAPAEQKAALAQQRLDTMAEVQLRHVEPVGAEHVHDIAAHDQPHPNWVLQDRPQPYEPTWHTLNLAQKGLITVAGVVGGTLVGAFSALVGLAAGAPGGGLVGVVSGAGGLPRLREKIAQRYSPATLNGVDDSLRIGGVGRAIHDFAHKLHCGFVGSVLGVPIGLVTGMGIGAVAGMAEAGRTGWGMGKALGHNVMRQLLGVEPFARHAHKQELV
jgi:putative component of membrane protein insertase Oxa1/YidC/SpoIIIJ protein YidD